MKKSLGLKIGVVVAAVLVCLFAIFPFIWMISVSFKPASEVYAAPTLFPKAPTLDGYKAMLSTTGAFSFTTWLRNSVIVSLCTTLFSLIIATLGAYGISRFHFKGRSALSYIILTTQVIPGALIVVPMYVIMGNMNLLDNMFGLILAYTTFTVPFCTWMMMGYFNTIPSELEQAAQIDGCNKYQSFARVICPLTMPGVAATAIYSFIQVWNEYMFSQTLMKTETSKTLTVGIAQMVGEYRTLWNDMMAASVLTSLPLIIVFLFLQKQFIATLTSGAVKG